jgi:acyl-homoserine lactone acylase PvdQ
MKSRLGLVCLLLIISALCASFYNSTLTRYAAAQAGDAQLKITGLKDKVTVRRDERDIPYIEAAN